MPRSEIVRSLDHTVDVVCVYICVCVCVMEYYLAIRKNSFIRKNAICSDMDGPRDYHHEVNQTEKDKYHMIPLICRI